jgi:hypothetical protein
MPTTTTEKTTAAPAWGTYRSAGDRYGLSRWTLRALVEEGRVRAARIGSGTGCFNPPRPATARLAGAAEQ